MNMMLVDEATGLKYKLQPSTEELEAGMIAHDPVHNAHLWDYITVDSVTYTNQPDLVDWGSDIEEWNPVYGAVAIWQPLARDRADAKGGVRLFG